MASVWLLAWVLSAGSSTSPPDRSLTSAQYVALGMAAPDRSWSPPDYDTAATVLEKLAIDDATRLPRYGSAMSGVVFARLVASDSIGSFIASAPDGQKIQFAMQAMLAARKILLTYLGPASRGVVMDRELAECMGLVLAMGALTSDLAAELLPVLPAEDPNHAQRDRGLAQVRSGLSQVVAGSLTSLTERGTYGPEARRALARHVRSYGPPIVAYLSELQRAELRTRLDQMLSTEQDAAVRQSLADAKGDLDALGPK